MNKTLPTWIPASLLLVGSLAFIAFTKLNTPQRTIAKAPLCQLASGNLYAGVQLYLDDNCSSPIATVLGGNKQGQIKLQYPDGKSEWKERDAITAKTFVRTSDPAIAAGEWQEFN